MKKILVLLALMLVSFCACAPAPSANQAPVLDAIGNKTVNEGQLLEFTISATDSDGDPLVYSATGLPSGATFSPATRTFSWTPNYNQAGSYQVTFTVSDGSLTDSETITITVNNVNQAPVLAPIGNKTVNEGQLLEFTISATDPDGDPLTYSASNLPSGASFDPATRTFSWTPSYIQAGPYEDVHFEVTDGTLTDSEDIDITVNEAGNQAPVLAAIGDKEVTEGQLLTFTISATDPDGDPLSYSASNLPSGASFDPATRTFSWTPSYIQAGLYEDVYFEVTDGTLTDSEDIDITVVNVTFTLNATIVIAPDTIKLDGKDKWITAYIELPTGYQPELVDLFTVRLNDEVPAVTDPKYDFVTDPNKYITDKDGDGILERMVKFDFSLVKPLLVPGDNVLVVTGRLIDWPTMPDFEGTDTVEVIE